MATSQKITTVSKDWLEALILANILTEKTKGRIGSGTTAAQEADTALETELAGSEKSWNSISQTDNETEYEYKLSFTEQNGNSISEVGIFSSDGDLHGHIVFPDDAITKAETAEYYFRITEATDISIN